MAMYSRYNSGDLIALRKAAWECLTERCAAEVPYSTLWRSQLGTDLESVEARDFAAVQGVSAFWFELMVLSRRRLVDRELTQELLEYQFSHWQAKFSPLVDATLVKDGDDFPEVLSPFRVREIVGLFTPRRGPRE